MRNNLFFGVVLLLCFASPSYGSSLADQIRAEFDNRASFSARLKVEQSATIRAAEIINTMHIDVIPEQTLLVAIKSGGASVTSQDNTVKPAELSLAIINSMVKHLHQKSYYLISKEAQVKRRGYNGSIVGIGVKIQKHELGTQVISTLPGSPAISAGLRPKDIITHVEGGDIAALTLKQIIDIIIGPKDSTVHLTVQRKGQSKDYSLVRKRININVDMVRMEDDVAVIRLATFSEGISKAIRRSLTYEIEKRSRPMQGVVIDLRNNGGGLSREGHELSDMFLDEGTIFDQISRKEYEEGMKIVTRRADKKTVVANNIPIVVLVNEGSASASEIVAAALSGNGRAILMGQKTFGKGTTQGVYTLANSGTFALTIGRNTSPKGEAWDGVGLTPDIAIMQDYESENDEVLDAALVYLRSSN